MKREFGHEVGFPLSLVPEPAAEVFVVDDNLAAKTDGVFLSEICDTGGSAVQSDMKMASLFLGFGRQLKQDDHE